MQLAADRKMLPIDVLAYPDILTSADSIKAPAWGRNYYNRFRIGGAKLTIDGSPQAKTAWLSQPYFIPPEGQSEAYAGYAAIPNDVTLKAVDQAFANSWQILAHANGDAAIDVFIAAVREATKKHGKADRRAVLIHGQTAREDQVDSLKELNIIPSFFPMHTFYWGDWHRDSVLGPVRADNISPCGWALRRGMIFTSHHDAPVANPDSMRVLSATVTRRTRSGDILGPHQRVPVEVALKSMTLWAAYQHFEENSKGSIQAGKLADLVILSDNPLSVDPEKLASLQVIETIKEGVTVYRAPA
jgi:predicted amidohydrolase YtcJ